MKALTILQPWASALVSGQKRYETRSWSTPYRGPIAIHAGKNDWWCPDKAGFSFGAILGTGTLIACHPVETLEPMLSPEERTLGDFSPGRYAWDIIDIVILATPIPMKGQQGLWACKL